MKHLGLILMSMALASWGFPALANAAEIFSRPIFTSDRVFVLEAPERATEIRSSDLPFEVRVFDRAATRCGLKPEDIQGKLSYLLREESALWQNLDLLFPGSRGRVRGLGVTLLIDDFTDFAGAQPAFASYYLRSSEPVIGLDCSALRQSYWFASLAHELTHALAAPLDLDSWWEEGLAQLLEEKSGGAQPALTLEALKSSSRLPHLLETRRPLPSRGSYALSYLFVKYVQEQFGSWPVLRAMSASDGDSVNSPLHAGLAVCSKEQDFLARIACRGHEWLIHSSSSLLLSYSPNKTSSAAERMTRNGLLRYFYVALSMSHSVDPAYQIGGWDGLAVLADRASPPLAPGDAWILPGTEMPEVLAPNTEAYRIQVTSDGDYRILPQGSNAPDSPASALRQDYVLVLRL